jgi:acyl-CoA dehydrogenase
MNTRSLIAQTVTALLEQGGLKERALHDPRAELWQRLCEHGIAHPFHGELSKWSQAGAILSASARAASALPIAENVIASYLLHAAGLPVPSARLTVCDPAQSALVLVEDRIEGTAKLVPHAAVSSHALAVAEHANGPVLVCFELRGVEAMPGENLAFEPRDALRVSKGPATRVMDDGAAISRLTLIGSLATSNQLTAWSEVVLSSSIDHARTRTQFGRPIAEFQAVRHALSVLAEHIALARCAVTWGEEAADRDATLTSRRTMRAIARAHIESRVAAQAAIHHGHAIHAALGFSFEHSLHRFTTRLMSYRAAFEAPLRFAHWLGSDILSRGVDALWNDLVSDG